MTLLRAENRQRRSRRRSRPTRYLKRFVQRRDGKQALCDVLEQQRRVLQKIALPCG